MSLRKFTFAISSLDAFLVFFCGSSSLFYSTNHVVFVVRLTAHRSDSCSAITRSWTACTDRCENERPHRAGCTCCGSRSLLTQTCPVNYSAITYKSLFNNDAMTRQPSAPRWIALYTIVVHTMCVCVITTVLRVNATWLQYDFVQAMLQLPHSSTSYRSLPVSVNGCIYIKR